MKKFRSIVTIPAPKSYRDGFNQQVLIELLYEDTVMLSMFDGAKSSKIVVSTENDGKKAVAKLIAALTKLHNNLGSK